MAETRTESGDDIYDLAEFRFGDTVIYMNNFTINYEITAERKQVTNSYTGADWTLSEENYAWECSEVLPKYKKVLEDRWEAQKSDKHGLTITTYNFLENGDYEEQCSLSSAIITAIDIEQETGMTLGVSGEALKRVRKNR